eukprot:jgi/Orpsp1_1/1183736/evm.model.c7180000086498.1
MKLKFLFVVILGIINAVIIGIIIKKQGFNNTILLLKDVLNIEKLENTKIANEKIYLNKEEILNDNKKDEGNILFEQIPYNEKDDINKKIESNKDIKNETKNIKKSNEKPTNMADFDISQINVGPLDVNCYIIGDPKSKKALVIDPGGSPEEILNICKTKGFELESIYLTH